MTKSPFPYVGTSDLRERWHMSRQGIHRRRKLDKQFPLPCGHINQGRDAVFSENDIIAYEQLRSQLVQKGAWAFCQSKDEWDEMSENEQALQRNPYYED